MVRADFSLTPWGNLESSINQMIEGGKKEKLEENACCSRKK